MPELSWVDVLLRLGGAALLTGAIGAERELRERAAGLRTHMLVGVGAALFTLVSAYAWGDFFVEGAQQRLDPTRIAAQIVSGIGFLGAGAILRQGLSVRGLTTAAGLWVAAAIGMACAAGFWPAALITTAIVMLGLGPFRRLEHWINRRGTDIGVVEVHLSPERSIGAVVDLLEPRRVAINGIEFDVSEDRRWVRLEVELPGGVEPSHLLAEIVALEDVEGARWSD
jgi:putative Mg2+ transporter-C (MgtC) family protein